METHSDIRQIIALGGGGFSMEPENPLLDSYILSLTPKKNPRVCFLPTASGDAQGYIDTFHTAFQMLPCNPSHLSLFRPPTADLRSFVMEQDILYVGGGNTKCMLALWREWSLDRILKEAWELGIVLAGISAGSICWFEDGVTDSVPGSLTALRGLGFLEGSNCPHYDGEEARRPAYHRLLAEGMIKSGLAADDGVALHFIGENLIRIVSSRQGTRAYRVAKSGNEVHETVLEPAYLGLLNKQIDHEGTSEKTSLRDES